MIKNTQIIFFESQGGQPQSPALQAIMPSIKTIKQIKRSNLYKSLIIIHSFENTKVRYISHL